MKIMLVVVTYSTLKIVKIKTNVKLSRRDTRSSAYSGVSSHNIAQAYGTNGQEASLSLTYRARAAAA